MYQAKTVFTGSAMPALNSTGGAGCAAHGCATKGCAAAQSPKIANNAMRILACIVHYSRESELAKQPSEPLDTVFNTAAAQCVPHDRLMRAHAVDAELALQHVE